LDFKSLQSCLRPAFSAKDLTGLAARRQCRCDSSLPPQPAADLQLTPVWRGGFNRNLSRLCYLRTWARRRHRAQSSELSRSRELRLRTRRSHAKSKDGLFGAAISSTWDDNRGRESEARLPPTPADPLQLR